MEQRRAGGLPHSTRLLITADAGGSNGYRTRAWKTESAALAAEPGLSITVCHFPPGTSKWNRIEHRLFSAITMNWRGRPLTSYEVIVRSIAATITSTGLTVMAELDPGSYPTGVEISDEQLAAVPLARHRFHAMDPDLLAHPDLTGIPRERLDRLIAELAEAQEARREQARSQRRGAERRRARGAGPKPKLEVADRILTTVLYLRKPCTQAVLGELFAVDKGTIGKAVQEISPLLDRHGYAITPSTARFPSPADLAAYLATGEIKQAC